MPTWTRWALGALLVSAGAACSTEVCTLDADCSGPARCVGGQCVVDLDPPPMGHVDRTDGWDQAYGTGQVFIIDELAIASEGMGFDLDGQCSEVGDCVDNALFKLGELGNDQIRQGLLGGETLLLFEITGIDEPFLGDDERVSWSIYAGEDADDPFFPANNFQAPVGEETCCEFRVSSDWLELSGSRPKPQGRGTLTRYSLSSSEPADLSFVLTSGDAPHPVVEIVSARLTGQMIPIEPPDPVRVLNPHGDRNFVHGLIGGVIPTRALAGIDNPYCKTLNQLCPRQLPDSKIIDLVGALYQPDIDLDGDGLESLEVGVLGRLSRCIDGDGSLVPPIDANQPWSCALRPEMADGYSVGIRFHAIPARIVP